MQKNHSWEEVGKNVDFRDPCFCDFNGFRVAPGSQTLVPSGPMFRSFPRRGVIFSGLFEGFAWILDVLVTMLHAFLHFGGNLLLRFPNGFSAGFWQEPPGF